VEVDEFLSTSIDVMGRELADALATSLGAGRRRDARRTLLRLAVDFWAWRRLHLEGLGVRQAAKLMAATVVDHPVRA